MNTLEITMQKRGFLFGSIFVFVGIFCFLGTFGIIETSGDKPPEWLGASLALAFILGGLAGMSKSSKAIFYKDKVIFVDKTLSKTTANTINYLQSDKIVVDAGPFGSKRQGKHSDFVWRVSISIGISKDKSRFYNIREKGYKGCYPSLLELATEISNFTGLELENRVSEKNRS